VPSEHDAVRWLGPEDLGDVDWLPADRPFLAELRAVLLDGDRLRGGNVGGAVRIGATVRRATGPWTPSVHALLELLRRAGLTEVPRVYGFDERGREVLEYLPGRVLEPDVDTPSAELLADAMRWLRRFHDVVAEASVAGPWRATAAPPTAAELVCHNDFAPYNVAVSTSAAGERLVGVFDWDLAGPATRVEELAFAAWNWVPMWQPLPAAGAASRLEVMAGAYGDVTAVEIVEGVVPRVQKTVDLIRAGQSAGDESMANLALIGEPGRTEAALEGLRRRVPEVLAALNP
jgi:8-oxo-dGTP diphosphatase